VFKQLAEAWLSLTWAYWHPDAG